MKLEENGSMYFRGKVVPMCVQTTDGRMDRQTDDDDDGE